MNAASQRRLTPSLVVAVGIFGVLLLSLLFGMDRGVSWDPPRPTPPLPTLHNVALPAPPPLDSYAQVWLHPLFSADRKPIVTTGGSEGASLGDLQLTGVIITPTLRIALLGPIHNSNSNGSNGDSKSDDADTVRVREGATLPDGTWKLIKVLPRSAIFASGSGRTELKLAAGAPIDQPAPGAPPGAIPMNGSPPGEGQAAPVQRLPPPLPPGAVPPSEAQQQRLQRLRAAIQKQRSGVTQDAQGEH